jgi:hypothetical protein
MVRAETRFLLYLSGTPLVEEQNQRERFQVKTYLEPFPKPFIKYPLPSSNEI